MNRLTPDRNEREAVKFRLIPLRYGKARGRRAHVTPEVARLITEETGKSDARPPKTDRQRRDQK